MDLERFVANRELLERLSREYELLKASGADVDYAAWVRQRLREAAAALAATTIGEEASSGNHQDGDSRDDPVGGAAPRSAHEQAEGAAEATFVPLILPTAEQLGFTRRPGLAASGLTPRPPLEAAAAASNGRPESAWFLRGEGTGPTSEALATAIFGPSGSGTPGFPAPAPAATQSAKATSRKTKRVVILSPRKSPPPQVTQPRPSPARQSAAAAPPVSKLYTRVEPGLFSARPDAYVHPQARERRAQPLAATRPDWVNAASLQAALRGSSSAVPHLQAAAERERRLALSTALARQTLAAGLGADEARAVALYGVSPAAAASSSSQAAQYDHVLLVAQQLAAQNEQLAMAVQLNSAQLAQQQALLDSALRQQHTDQSAPEGAGAAAGTAPGGPVVEVESGPPPWFLRRAPPGPAAAGGKRGQSTSFASKLARGTTTSTTTATKSPTRKTAAATQRARSPPPTHNIATLLTIAKPTGALVAGTAATAETARAAAAAVSATTAKERDRSSRREALKALLKQVLGGAGLAGGREGRQRLASSMAEAEKLVEAIQALARKKAQGRDGGGETLPAVTTTVAAETQTSGRVSGSGGGAAAEAATAAVAVPVSAVAWNPITEPRQPSRAASVAHSRSVASAAGGASSRGGSAPGPGSSRALSQGSGPGRGSSDGEVVGALSPLPPSPKAASRVEALVAGPSRHTSPPGSARERNTASPPSSTRETAAGTASRASSAAGGPAVAPAAACNPTAAAPAFAGAAGPGHIPQAHARTAMAAALRVAAPPPPPGGLLVESLEDQVQQIVERDAAVAAEMARLQKLDALEQRLHSMVDRVETKLARVLQPLQLNAQQQLLGPAAAAALGALQIGPEGQPQHGAAAAADAAAAAAAAGEPSVATLAAAIVAAAAAGAGAGTEPRGAVRERHASRSGGGGGYTAAAGVNVASPRSAGLSVLELQRMLIQINRMESKEQEVRRKWFHDARGPRQRGRAGQPIVVRDGQLGTLLHPHQPPSPRTASPRSCSRSRSASPHAGHAAPWSSFRPQSPTSSVLATVAADSSAHARMHGSARKGPGPSPGSRMRAARFREPYDGASDAGAEDLALDDPISDATLESVLRGRRRFLRAQQLADGDLLAASQPSLNPVQIMEDLTDALLEEVLHEQAQELAGFCDTLGEHMFKDEFDLSDDDDLDGRR